MWLSPVYPHCEHWLAAVDMVRPPGEDWGDHAALDASPPLSRTNPNLKPAVGLPPIPHGLAIPCNSASGMALNLGFICWTLQLARSRALPGPPWEPL